MGAILFLRSIFLESKTDHTPYDDFVITRGITKNYEATSELMPITISGRTRAVLVCLGATPPVAVQDE